MDHAAEIYKKRYGADHTLYADILVYIARIYEEMKFWKAADYIYTQVEYSRKKNLGTAHIDYATTLIDLGKVKWKREKTDDALRLLKNGTNTYLNILENEFPFMTDHERENFWEHLRPAFNHYFTLLVSQESDSSQNIVELYEKFTATKGLLYKYSKYSRARITDTDSLQQQHFSNIQIKREELAYLYGHHSGKHRKIEKLEAEVQSLEREILTTSLDEKPTITLTPFDTVRALLAKDEATVDILRIVKSKDSIAYYALILKPEEDKPILEYLGGNELEERFYAFYKNNIRYKLSDTLSYTRYWSKIQRHIPNAKRVYLSTDGIYHKIQVNSFLTPENQYLVDHIAIMRISASTAIFQQNAVRKNSNTKNVELFGFPNYGSSGKIPQLPATLDEVNIIESTFESQDYKVEKFTGDIACEEQLKNLKDPFILHLATHGFFKEDITYEEKSEFSKTQTVYKNPLLQSGIYLCNAGNETNMASTKKTQDDGVFTAYEALNLDLKQTEIVVLSACETGLGEIKNGEGIYGLQRSFQIAGAKSVIMSLWKVDDKATQHLMVQFYKNWNESEDKALAFRNSVLQLKKEYPLPYYWGAFVLISD
jgi:CHAT domain-containing protein